MKTPSAISLIFCLSVLTCHSDTLVLKGGTKVSGTIIRTNDRGYVLLTDTRTYVFSKESIKGVALETESSAETAKTSRLPNFKTTVLSLNRQPWAANLTQIPATVIDNGDFRNVPYSSFRCGEDYEVNIYGDLQKPVAIEVGVYRQSVGNEAARRNCVNFIAGLLGQSKDKEVLQSLNWEKDLKQTDGLSFEVTPPTAPDAFMGWWVSIYSLDGLNQSRASEEELATISISKSSTTEAQPESPWTAEEMKLARSQPETIDVVTSSGETISNATVVRVVDNAYLIWRKDGGGGKARLSDLPTSVQKRFGYDDSRASSVYAADEAKKKAQDQAYAQAAQAAAATQSQTSRQSSSMNSGYFGGGYSDSSYVPSSSGRVYVSGYYRKDGTYVRPHTRRR